MAFLLALVSEREQKCFIPNVDRCFLTMFCDADLK